jgi:hypothetical protein
MENRVFFPQAALDQWIVDGNVDLNKGELTILGEGGQGRRYLVEEAVRVMKDVSGEGDTASLIGRVKTRAWLESQGGEIVETSMLLGDAAYDVEPGWVGTPVGTYSQHLAGPAASAAGGADWASSDEELLAKFLARHL